MTATIGGRAPTLHGLRHTFAVPALVTSPTGRQQVGQAMRALATYLGHVSIVSTYWYLEATPELLTDVAGRASVSFRRGAASLLHRTLTAHAQFLREFVPDAARMTNAANQREVRGACQNERGGNRRGPTPVAFGHGFRRMLALFPFAGLEICCTTVAHLKRSAHSAETEVLHRFGKAVSDPRDVTRDFVHGRRRRQHG